MAPTARSRILRCSRADLTANDSRTISSGSRHPGKLCRPDHLYRSHRRPHLRSLSSATTPSPRRTCPPRSRFTPSWTAIAPRHRPSPAPRCWLPGIATFLCFGRMGYRPCGSSVLGARPHPDLRPGLPLAEDTTFVASLRPGVGHCTCGSRRSLLQMLMQSAHRRCSRRSSRCSTPFPQAGGEAEKTDADALRELIDLSR